MGETQLPAAVILWAAGVAASPLGKKLGAPVDRAGRVLVNPDLSLPGHPEVFVIGDLAALKDEEWKWLPGVAPVAMQEGKATAHNIAAELQGEPRKNFHYFNKGNLATIGRAAAVAEFGKIHISGFLAWLAWLFVHIFFLIGFRNRIIVLVQWAWSYFTYERGARLITGRQAACRDGSEMRQEETEIHSTAGLTLQRPLRRRPAGSRVGVSPTHGQKCTRDGLQGRCTTFRRLFERQ